MTETAWFAAWRELERAARPDGFGALFHPPAALSASSPATALLVRRARHALPLLMAATRACDALAAEPAVEALAGVGPGLTPSGDDVLIGYACGLSLACRTPHRFAFLAAFRAMLVRVSETTSAASRSHVQRAAAGEPPQWLRAPMNALAHGDAAATAAAARDATRIGHTSGVDTMLGLLLSLAAWTSRLDAARQLAAIGCAEAEQTSEAHAAC